ncbi:uncharacterized protein LOC127366413 isoform X2 [Dicentrarchus labrax]|uniref:uncharacterized protein LOC127366413 isoform X2 n=1 Tax=Dicentrarchus labrax TaxID=13489 RepID=UPI0021F60B70|nr:uncharacterized protein LOC127366413 isoform X2 [Dicentrarchus labrax]
MTHPTDYFLHPRSESGQSLHTQESGDAGLSSNMAHQFSDDYSVQRALPVVDKGSFVIPIPNAEPRVFEHPEMSGRVKSHTSVFRHAAFPVAPPLARPVSAEKLSTVVVINSQAHPKEETAMVLPGTALTEEQSELVGGESCIMDTNKNTGANPREPKGPPLIPGRKIKVKHRKKRAAGKNWKLYLQCCMVLIALGGFPAVGSQPPADQGLQCFICKDEERCPNLATIYDSDDTLVYEGDLNISTSQNKTLPECCGISDPTPKTCVVCRYHSTITIICSENVTKMEVEDSKGGQILNISSGCVQRTCGPAHNGLIGVQPLTHGHYGLIASVVLYVVAALVIYID